MSNTLIRRIVEFFIAIFILGGVIAVLRGIAAAFSGSFGRVGWTVTTDTPSSEELASQGSLSWTHGALQVDGQPFAHLFDIATSLAVIALLLVAMFALRRFLLALAEGQVFTKDTVVNLRKIGFALLATCLVSIIDAVVIQSIILSSAELPGDAVLHPSISWDVAGVENIWLDYDVPLASFVLGGLALLMAEAFKAGQAYREDSESVV